MEKMSLINICEYLLSHYKEINFSHTFIVDQKRRIIESNCTAYFCHILGRSPEKAFLLFDVLSEDFETSNLAHDLEIGDTIIWRKKNPPRSGDTGHLIIIKEILQSNEERIRVKVFDISRGHHDNDTRENSTKSLGQGEMTLTTQNGKLNGLIWSSLEKKEKRTPLRIIKTSGEVFPIEGLRV